MTTVFVGNLAATTTEGALRQIFQQYGTVGSVRLMSRRRLAYVELEREDAVAAVDGLRGTQIEGSTVDIVLDESPGGRKGRRGSRGHR